MQESMEQAIISAVTYSETDVVFTLTGIPDRPGVAAMIFDRVASAHVNVDTIIQNVVHGKAEMSFSVPAEDVPATREAIGSTQDELGAFAVETNEGLGKVSLIGAGMRSHPGVAATMFRTLADLGINLEMISTSPIKISCMIARERIPEAVRDVARRVRARARAAGRADDLILLFASRNPHERIPAARIPAFGGAHP